MKLRAPVELHYEFIATSIGRQNLAASVTYGRQDDFFHRDSHHDHIGVRTAWVS